MLGHLRCQALLQGLQNHLPNAIRGTELQGRKWSCCVGFGSWVDKNNDGILEALWFCSILQAYLWKSSCTKTSWASSPLVQGSTRAPGDETSQDGCANPTGSRGETWVSLALRIYFTVHFDDMGPSRSSSECVFCWLASCASSCACRSTSLKNPLSLRPPTLIDPLKKAFRWTASTSRHYQGQWSCGNSWWRA